MNTDKLKNLLSFSLLAMVLLLGPGNAYTADSRSKLLAQEKQLKSKIESLQREQDFLLFEKTMYSSDSKYLLFDMKSKTGQLKYKNRLLRDFTFTSKNINTPKPGMISVTEKMDSKDKKNALVFGNALILLGKRNPKHLESATPRVTLSQKDFRALFYTLEQGSPGYIVR